MFNPFNATKHPFHFKAYEQASHSLTTDSRVDGGAPGNVEMVVNTVSYAAYSGTITVIGDNVGVAMALCIEAITLIGESGALTTSDTQDICHTSVFDLVQLIVTERISRELRSDPSLQQVVKIRNQMYEDFLTGTMRG